jgi:flagellar biosynthetic protein FliR
MFELDVAALQHWITQFTWPLMRISGFCMIAPILGTALVPPRVRLLLVMFLTLAIAPHLQNLPKTDLLSPLSVVLIAQQLLIGIGLGFFLQLMTQTFVMFGQIAAMQMGLGFASMNDPINGVSVASVSQFYLMLVTLLFLSLNGHLMMIEVLAESFYTLPVGADIGGARLQTLLGWASWMFGAGLLMSLPAVTALLIINCTLGVITRAAPQLNIFAIGFPLMVLLGIMILWVSINTVLPQFEQYNSEALQAMRAWVS